jgi:ubiquinone/menaquinone biosynthesis C-methylase UbiE
MVVLPTGRREYPVGEQRPISLAVGINRRDAGEMSDAIVRYYTHDFVEHDRLSRQLIGKLEFLRTQELLRRYLPPPPAAVLDVGGATGAHAAWLLADGYRTELIDLTPAHVEQARQQVPELVARVGDARNLEVADDAVDAALLLGPLYHLADASDRERALSEAVRVTRSGGVVAAAAIGKLAALMGLAVEQRLTDQVLAMVRQQISSGRHNPQVGFTDAYMHSPDELHAEMVAAGLTSVVVYTIEGPLWAAVQALRDDETVDLAQFMTVARELETNEHALALGSHLLAVGRTP